jgi:hypothetical protein
MAEIGSSLLCLMLAVVISMSVIKPAAAYHGDLSYRGSKAFATESMINCDAATDATLPHTPSGCNDETCCVFNTNRSLDDETANIGVLLTLIAIIPIETVKASIPVQDFNILHDSVAVYRANYAQPPPRI